MTVQRDYPIETFDPLLRDLVGWGLLERRLTKEGASWHLAPAAEQRLEELLPPVQVPAPEAIVYLDHRCADCHRRGLTRLRGDIYVCDGCWAGGQARMNAADEPPRAEHAHFWHRTPPPQTTTLAS